MWSMVRAILLAGLVLASAGVAATSAAGAVPPPRVTMIADSVGGVLSSVEAAQQALGRGLDFRLEASVCRKLVEPGCFANGDSPPSVLDTIRELGSALGRVVIVDVGYNDVPDGYADALDRVMRALVDLGIQHVVWVTLEETEDPWVAINPQIRSAPARWPQLVVADWAPVAAAHPEWFVDLAHMNDVGALGFASFLRPIVLAACGSLCDAVTNPPKPEATLLRPVVGVRSATVRWRGNEIAVTYDLAVKALGRRWRTVVSRLGATSRRLRGEPGRRIQVRVRARDGDGRPGAWSRAQSIRFRIAA